jgi:ATP-dependent DNA helicase RecQ
VRLGLAQGRGIPAYMILHDSVLQEMARTRPSSEEELADLKQVGPNRARQFGKAFLEAIDRHLERGD